MPIASSAAWPATLAAVAVYALWLTGWYWDTVSSMVAIWYRSETFVHGFLVFPISLWLVWRQRRELARLAPQPRVSLVPLVVITAAGVLWLLGDLADVLAARQLAWITMLVAGVWLLVGDTVARRLAFPLAFLYFAVPIGEFLLPVLIERTADFTVAALRLSGVPVFREGMTFQIPTGSWSVVEACSGLRYLIASITVGVLYAYLTYRTWTRRLLFVAASIVTPIIANWLRAYMIVMIGHLSGNKLAVGIDHIIYGWIFFGAVMLLLFWIGNFWRQETAGSEPEVPLATPPEGASIALAIRSVALIAALVVTATAPAAIRLLHGDDLRGSIDVAAPPLGDWRPVAGTLVDWTPEFTPPRAAIASTYEKAGERTGLYIALYYDQDQDSKLVSSSNQLLRTTAKIGRVLSEHDATIDTANGPLEFRESELRIRDRRVLVRSWLYIDGQFIASPIRAKLAQASARLHRRGDAGAIVVVYAILPADGKPVSAALDALTREAAAALPRVLGERFRAMAAP